MYKRLTHDHRKFNPRYLASESNEVNQTRKGCHYFAKVAFQEWLETRQMIGVPGEENVSLERLKRLIQRKLNNGHCRLIHRPTCTAYLEWFAPANGTQESADK